MAHRARTAAIVPWYGGARTAAIVPWYGGGDRRVAWVSGTGLWYRGGAGVVPLRWVFVRDRQGTHQDQYFYTTDPALTAPQIIHWFTARWPIETTFQEMRAHLGLETTRQHVASSVLRTAPCLLDLFTVVCLVFAAHAQQHPLTLAQTSWYRKEEPTFTDAIATVRRLCWQHTLLQDPSHRTLFQKLPPSLKNWMLDQLCQAA